MSRLDEIITDIGYIKECLQVYRGMVNGGNCNNCKVASDCPYRPTLGMSVRYNCPFYNCSEFPTTSKLTPLGYHEAVTALGASSVNDISFWMSICDSIEAAGLVICRRKP